MTTELRNRQVFARDPLKTTLPNDGVARVVEPTSPQEWDVLRYELQSFVCDGEYRRGLERILSTYLSNLGETVQPAVWISGFFGSGKSHLARVLEVLWRDVRFPDGATARGLANLPDSITDSLQELTTFGRREGGLWSAAGRLGAGSGDNVRLAFLGVVFGSAGLPTAYPAARLVIWLKQNGWHDGVRAAVEARGKELSTELWNMYVSPVLASAILDACPGLADSEKGVRELLRTQYPSVTGSDISNEDLVNTLRDVLALQSTKSGKVPCVLIALDELQQFIGDSSERTLRVQELVEACSARFQSQILFVATGQAGMQGTPQIDKLQGRFTVQVALSDTDVERVVRDVALRKAPDRVPDLQQVLDSASGEIDRHLGGTKIAAVPADRPCWVADYPILPTRRRFWERVLRAVDREGATGQLRNQLRIVHEATRAVAEENLGFVVGGDFIFDQIVPAMRQGGVLLPDTEKLIRDQKDGSGDGVLRERLCQTIFLINQLPAGPGAETGLRATAPILSDLMVTDLPRGSDDLRQRIPRLLEELLNKGAVMKLGDEYRLQTKESAEWESDFRSRRARFASDESRIATDRINALRKACDEALRSVNFPQGASKVPRKIEIRYTADQPQADSGAVPVWIRDEWSASEKTVREDVQAAGVESPLVSIFLPRAGTADALKEALAGAAAAAETLQTRPAPATPEGVEARAGIQTRQAEQERQVTLLLERVLKGARVFQGGGSEVTPRDSLRATVQAAAEAALARLYPQFLQGDNPQWRLVAQRVRQGSGDPLEALGYSGDPAQQPVCAAILSFTGAGGRKGADIRKQFGGAPWGWPQDTIDGALYALGAAGRLQATYNGQPAAIKTLEQSKLGQAEFRTEGTIVSTAQKIEVRKLFNEAGIVCKTGEEAAEIPAYLDHLITLAGEAGGDPPLPARPSCQYLLDLKSRVGNDGLVAVFEARDRLKDDRTAWLVAKKAAADRLPRWRSLLDLLEQAEALPVYADLKPQVDAIQDNRSLLSDPDPVPALCGQLADDLRAALTTAQKRYNAACTAQLATLEASESWKGIQESQRTAILSRNRLEAAPALKVGTEADLIAALDDTPLSTWDTRQAALPQRVSQALLEAAQLLEPEAVSLTLPKASLRTVEEVDAYLQNLRATILKQIEAGRSVVL